MHSTKCVIHYIGYTVYSYGHIYKVILEMIFDMGLLGKGCMHLIFNKTRSKPRILTVVENSFGTLLQ